MPRKLTCFVAMPYGGGGEYAKGKVEADHVYKNIIAAGVKMFVDKSGTQVELIREDEKAQSGSIARSMIRDLAEADICIVDITGGNPNVFFELGVRYSHKTSTTILIRQDTTKIPFDISDYRCFSYDCFEPAKAIRAIADALGYANDNSQHFDSPVQMLEEISQSESRVSACMDWESWHERIKTIAEMLRNSETPVSPDLILGISNGGMAVADLMSMHFPGTPVMGLYADRKRSLHLEGNMFHSPFNGHFSQLISSSSHFKRVLIVDDAFVRGGTIKAALQYLVAEIGEQAELLYLPLTCRDIKSLKNFHEYIPATTKEGASDLYELIGSSDFFPYKKF